MHVFFYILGALQLIGALLLAGSGDVGIALAFGIGVSALFMFAFGYIVDALGQIERASERTAAASEATLEVLRAIREKRPERTPQEIGVDEYEARRAEVMAAKAARKQGAGWQRVDPQ